MAQQCLSPLVQVMQTPSLVISQVQLQQAKLQLQQGMPFIVQVIEHMPPAIMRQRFCSVPQAISSSQQQTILQPPAHFSILISQRGTTHQVGIAAAPGIDAGDIGMAPGMLPMAERSNIMELDIATSIFVELRRTSGESSQRRAEEMVCSLPSFGSV